MDSQLLQNMVSQFPSLVGLFFAVLILWQIIKEQAKKIDRLIDALIKRENCDEQ